MPKAREADRSLKFRMHSEGFRFYCGAIGYKISLLRVAPGRESAVAGKLRQAIFSRTGSSPTCLLKVFGRYDICAIYRTRDYLDGPSLSGPIEGIRGGNKILAFHWRTSREEKSLSVERKEGAVWALSFFRFNETLLKYAGIRMELLLARALHSIPNRPVALDVLGTTGWAESIILIRGRRFQDVSDTLSWISRQKVSLTVDGKTKDVLVPEKTLSILGIDFNLTHSSRRQALRNTLQEPFDKTGLSPHLSVTCPPAAMGAIQQYATPIFGAGAITYGTADFIFTPESGNWGGFIADVLDLRKSLRQEVYSTSIGLSVQPTNAKLPKLPFAMPQRRGLRMPPILRTRTPVWDPMIGHRLRSLYFALSNFMQDPLIGNCFDDLRPLAQMRLPDMLSSLDPGDSEDRSLLDSLIEILAYAVEERAHGAFAALEHLEGSLSPTKGGIQRILIAASSIPRTLLARAKKEWYGFLVAGHYHEHFTSHYEALNLPYECLFRPEDWCGLFHETGHAAFFDKTFYDMDGSEMSEIISSVGGAHKTQDNDSWKLWTDFAWEIGADLFSLYFAYGKNISLYLRNIWPNLIRKRRTLSPEHFLRFFIVFETWKHLLMRDEVAFPNFRNLQDELIEYSALLKKLRLLSTTDPESIRGLDVTYSAMSLAAESFLRTFRAVAPPKQLDVEMEDPAMQAALRTVLRGQPFVGRIDQPDTFILLLRQHQRQLKLSSRLAAIMSLWHSDL